MNDEKFEMSVLAGGLTWEQVKRDGSSHYKSGDVEPIDLYRAGGMLRHFAICNIIKYAYRNRDINEPIRPGDLDKIIHYVKMLKVACGP